MSPQFAHPSDSQFNIEFLIDPHLSTTYIRDALISCRVMVNYKGPLTDLVNYAHCLLLISLILGKEIAWKYIVQLRRLQEKENVNIPDELMNVDFNFRQKLNKVFIHFYNSI